MSANLSLNILEINGDWRLFGSYRKPIGKWPGTVEYLKLRPKLNISKTNKRDASLVSIVDIIYDVAFAESNGHMTDDVRRLCDVTLKSS